MGTKNVKSSPKHGSPGQPKGSAASMKKPAHGVQGQRLSSSGGKGTKKTLAERSGG